MNKLKLILIPVALIAFLLVQALYTVKEQEKALTFRFGRIVSDDNGPGLHMKLPFVDSVRKFDARIQTTSLSEESYLTLEKKNLIVDSFVKWRVINPRQYFINVSGNPATAAKRLTQRVNDSLRGAFGQRTVKEVVSGDRVRIMEDVQKAVDVEARAIGIEVVDVRLKRVDLDQAVIRESVYPRMAAERQRIATEIRAFGRETAEKIKADADRQKAIILADAYNVSEALRGEGDAKATEIFANAYGQDREFFNMFRSFNAYRNTFSSKSDLLIVDPESQFFDYFKQSEPKP